MADDLKFTGITHVGKAGAGLFKITANQLGWKCTEPGMPDALVQISGKEVESAFWQRACGRGKALLKLIFKGDGGMSRFAGFKSSDKQSLQAHMSSCFGVNLVEESVATKGWSWGDWKLENDHHFQLMSEDKVGLEVPLSDISQVNCIGETDLILDFHEDDTAAATDEVLHEIRFFVQGGMEANADSLRKDLWRRAQLSERGEVVAQISDIALTAPRGKHDFEFLKQTVKVRGKTQTYTIKYSSIARLFLLTLPDHNKVTLVIGLDQPLRQGQQTHDFLVLNFDRDEMTTANVKLPEEKLKQYNIMPGSRLNVHTLVAALLKVLTGKAIVTANSDFKVDFNCSRCNCKAQNGYLFPLKKSLIFIVKPVVWVRYDEIETIEFRTAMLRKNTFDMVVHLRGLPSVEFVQLEKKVFQPVLDVFTGVGVKISNLRQLQSDAAPGHPGLAAASSTRRRDPAPAAADAVDASDAEEDDPEDEDFAASDEDDDDDDDDEESADDDLESEDEKPRAKRARKK